MTLLLHEIKRNKLALIIWTAVISFMLGICILIYPEMSKEMANISDMFADMGAFTDAFGMDQINFGEFMGYFGIECGNVLGMGGAIFAAILGISALAGEQKNGTAEFLLTHPVSRIRIAAEKLLYVAAQILALNVAVALICTLSILAVGVEANAGQVTLIFLAYTVLQLEIGAISFCISAFVKNGGFGIGIGVAMLLYFLNIVANISESIEFLKYVTPFAYTDSGYIINNNALEFKYLVIGIIVSAASVAVALWQFKKKDIN